MKILWQRGISIVRDVYKTLLEQRKIAYTTVMTMMRILEVKGYLVKCAAEKAHVYQPASPKELVLGGMVHDFLQRVLSGPAKPLLLHLIDDESVSQEELDEISMFLKKRSGRR